MNKIVILFFWAVMPMIVNAQNNEGIKFSASANWQELLAEAREANKPIFVDLYATWCVPCKMMDKQVYPNKQVAEYVNANFIAVKVQTDTTKQDNNYIKGWYKDAAYLKGYASAYPSFLFFDANGKYSGREMGFYKADDFVILLKKAIDPKGSYLGQLKAFEEGSLSKTQMAQLVLWAKSNKDDSSALRIARVYKAKYIDKVPLDSILNSDQHKFISNFLELFSFDDEVVWYMYKHPEDANRKFAAWQKYSTNVTDWIIVRDYIFPVSKPNGVHLTTPPDWKGIEKKISHSFDKEKAKRLVLDAKIWRANELKNWDDAAVFEFEKMDKYGIDTVGLARAMLNNFVYSVVFMNIEDTSLLRKAVKVMNLVVEADKYSSQERLDTYASILYKSGKKQRAIEIEEMALKLAIDKKNQSNVKFYTDMINKMKRDVVIWNEK